MNQSQAVVRLAQANDFDKLVEMLQEMAADLSLNDRLLIVRDDIADRRLRLDRFRQALFGEKPLIESLVLEIDKLLVGMCTFHTSFSTYRGQPGVFLEDLFVKKDLQGKGYGRQLFRKLVAIAESRNCYRMVWNIPERGGRVHNFYKSLGGEDLDGPTMVFNFDTCQS